MGLEVLLIEIQTNHHQSFHSFTFNSVLSVKALVGTFNQERAL